MAEVPPSEHLKDLLASHVLVSDWEIQISVGLDHANIQDDIIIITDTLGLDPNPKWLLDFPSCQIIVRGKPNTYLDTFREAKAVKDILLGVDSFTTAHTDRIVAVNMLGDLNFIGRDEGMRPMFSMNFSLIIEPQSVVNSNRVAL